MGDKKHIDRLFQERFKDFEVTPDDAVWNNIEAKLKAKKKKHRIIPIWWRYAGVAALLLLLLTIGGIAYFNHGETPNTPQIVDTEKSDINTENPKNQQDLIKKDTQENTVISEVDTAQDRIKEEGGSTPKTQQSERTLQFNQQSPSVANSNDTPNTDDNKDASISNNKVSPEKLIHQDVNKALAENKVNSQDKIESASQPSTTVKQQDNISTSEQLIAQKSNPSVSNNAIEKTKDATTKDNITSDVDETISIAENKPSDEPETIEEAIEKNKSLLEEDINEKLNKWSVAPNVAPVYFSSLGKGSSIDSQFNNNSKSGEVNMSYGINASYAINEKVTIRSGINRVNLGYNTNDVVVFRSLNASASTSSAIKTVSSTTSGNVADTPAVETNDITIVSAENFNASNSPASLDTANTTINQSFGYIEIPLEIQYALSTKRFGVNVIGGFSSLFLNNNDLFSEIDGQRTRLGEANNINKTSYSANFGLGLNYKISEKINLNLEPMFKYQINTFRNTSGDFQPFFIGVYTGFGIKF